MNAKDQVRQYIAENLLFSDDGCSLPDDASFLEEGILDSTGVLELVMFVEQGCNIAVRDDEIVPENFDSINRLATYISRKTAATSATAPSA